MVGKFHLPAGARFDLASNTWRAPPTHIRFSFVPREGADPDEDIVISVGRVLRSSPTYGFTQPDVTPAGPPLKEGERGIILSPPVIAKGEVVELHNKIDPAELRSALLLYDRIESPHVSMVVFELGRDAQYLAELGILHRTEPLVPTIQPGECIVKSHLLTMAALEARDGQVWSLARGERSLSLWEADVTAGRGALFELHHAIPIPDRDVPIDDILEFKRKRDPELTALRSALDAAFERVGQNPDAATALENEIASLDKAVADQIRVSREFKFPFVLSNFKARIDYKTFAAGAASFDYAQKNQMPLTLSLLAGAAGATFCSISTDVGRRRPSGSLKPFEYVSEMHNRLY
jgi:hypothetical protein